MNQEEQPILNAINQSFSYDHEEPEEAQITQSASYPILQVSQPPVFKPVVQAAAPQPVAQPQIVVQRPVYNAVGVPMQVAQPMQRQINLPALQGKVKCWSKFLVVVSYLMMISGAIKFISNLFMLFNTGSFSNVAWYDRKGNYRTIKMDEGALALMAIIQMVAGGYLVFKQGKLTKMIFAPILEEYRQAEAGQTNGIQMTYRKAPKMQWLKKMVKKITCGIISLTLFSLIVCKNFAHDIISQIVTQEFAIMEKKNQTTIDFSMDPEQFWVNPKSDVQPVFQPFKFDDDMDFDFQFETDEDIFSGKELKESDIFKMLGNMNETSVVTPYFNTTEIEEPMTFNTTMPLPLGRGDHDKKHHYKHHQKHPKNMMKHGFEWDMHKMTKEECIRKADMVVSFVMFFCAFWATMCILFWQGLFICAINQVKKPQSILENHFMGPVAGTIVPQTQAVQGTIQYIAVQPNQVQPQYVQVAPQAPVMVATGNIARANTFE